MEKYIIKQNTVYIHGIKIDDHIVHSEICEAGKDPFMVKSKPQEIMNQSCRFYGEHFNERKQFTKRLTNITRDRKSTRLNSSHDSSSYAVFCLHYNIRSR